MQAGRRPYYMSVHTTLENIYIYIYTHEDMHTCIHTYIHVRK